MGCRGKPPAFLTLLRILACESMTRCLSIFPFPMQGGKQSSPLYARRHRNKVTHTGDRHMLCHVLDRGAAQMGTAPASLWKDPIHPTLEGQQYLRDYGTFFAPLVSESEQQRSLILVIADGWNSPTPAYFAFRARLEQCITVGDVRVLQLPNMLV